MVAVRHRTVLAVPGQALAAVPGFQVQITELPSQFSVGANPSTVTVVASTNAGRRCQKVRWSMLMRVNGIALDQVSVDRVEDSGSFPLAVQSNGDTARLTDVNVDPGELCNGRTVTARYQVSFAQEVTDGQVTLQAEAYDTTERLLQAATVTREVVGGTAVEPGPTEDADPTPTPTEDAADDDESTDPTEAAETSPTAGAIAAVPAAKSGGDTSLLGAGVVVGAVLIFLGVGLLLRLRMRNKRTDVAAAQPFYPSL
jgi:hypothetical protein